MTYTSTDPRSALTSAPKTTAPKAASAGTSVARPALWEFRSDNVRIGSGSWSWLIRAQNLVLEYAILEAGASVSGNDEPDESVAFTVGDGAEATVAWAGTTVALTGRALAIIPRGSHTVTAHTPLHLIRLFTTALGERTEATENAADYAEPHPQVTPLTLWPEPEGEDRLRHYRLADYPPEPGRFGNIFRSRAFMINFLPTAVGPRDPTALSPHTHDDFEQLSLAVEGEFVHHIRTPWTPRRLDWVDDVHWRTAAPSVAIIPPPTVHTSENVAAELNALIDIFSPPRLDFSAQPGWVLNAADYPLPATDSVD